MNGELVGIASAKYVATGYENMGFAISINEVMPIIEELAQYGYVKSRGTLPIDYQVIDRAMSQYYNLPTGLYVTQINGDCGDLQAGYIVTEVNGTAVDSEADLTNAVSGKTVGDSITVRYYNTSTQQYAQTEVTLVESTVQDSSSDDQSSSNNGYSDYYDYYDYYYGNGYGR